MGTAGATVEYNKQISEKLLIYKQWSTRQKIQPIQTEKKSNTKFSIKK